MYQSHFPIPRKHAPEFMLFGLIASLAFLRTMHVKSCPSPPLPALDPGEGQPWWLPNVGADLLV